MTRDQEMTEVVRREVGEALDELLSLTEKATSGSLSTERFVRDAFRIFHNTKGALHLGGFSEVERVAHAVEDHLAKLRSTGASPSSELLDLMEQAMSVCLYAVEGDGTHPEIGLVIAKLAGATAGEERVATRDEARAEPSQVANDDEAGLRTHETIRIDSFRLDRLMDLGSEYLAQHGRLRRQRADLRDFADRFLALTKREPSLKSLLKNVFDEFETFVRQEERELRRVTQLTAEFDRAMREIRMQPLEGIVPQLRRIVGEASRELEKKAHLTTDLGEVELDREVIDALREPLIHLIRNAIDHGLEGESERVSAGKSPRGEVRLEARVEGANVEIAISDDGRGIDLEKVRSRALELGVSSGSHASDEELIDRALFSAGFSTASQVTSYSGRGVGLDVVRSRVTELGGSVRVGHGPNGAGVTFTLSVPTSVVSLRGLCVTAGGDSFVLPNANVKRTLRVRASCLGSTEGATIAKIDDAEPLRLRWLASEMKRPRSDDPEILQVVVVNYGSEQLGLVVDEVQGDTTYVIKRLPWNLRSVPGVVGATHQGNAALALVVDPGHIFRANNSHAQEHRIKAQSDSRKRRVLVADDSLTSRTLERNILIEAGYEVQVAEDGRSALHTLQQGDFDLLVSDVQMPHMDGIELTRAVRSHAKFGDLPIILVTSLARPEDIALGAEAGADEYIVKGQFDQEALLRAVNRLL